MLSGRHLFHGLQHAMPLVPAVALVSTGYTLSGWNTAADSRGTAYAPGAGLTVGSANVTLYSPQGRSGVLPDTH